MDVDGYRESLRPLFAGRKIVLTGAVVPAHTGQVTALRELGSERCLVIAGPGTGPAPEEDDAEVLVIDIAAPDMVEDIRHWERLHGDPPPEVVDAVERYDPDGEALVLFPPFDSGRSLVGRASWGARSPAWTALEDKTLVDGLCDRAGVPRPPSEIVPVEPEALRAAAGRLDAGAGTVWAGDARDGFNGGAVFVHWVRDDDDADAAVAALAPHCDHVRVAPFLEGIPCSVHGVVTGDGVAALRPVELLTLRSPVRPHLRYAGTATVWDPEPADREAMRDAARCIGEVLRAEAAFRSFFTVDGVLTAEGFRPTEVNPRFGAGLLAYGTALPELPLPLLHRAIVAGALDPSAAELEAILLPAADATRVAVTAAAITDRRPEPAEADLSDGAHVQIGPSAMGGFMRVTLDVASLPPGRPVGPAAAAALCEADARFGLGLGPLEGAVAVR